MFQVSLIPYFKLEQDNILYASVFTENQFCPLELIGIGSTNETIRQTAIRTFAMHTGMYLNPIRFEQLMCSVTLPITEIQNEITDENILMIPRYYISVQLPHKISSIDSKQVIFNWSTYETLMGRNTFPIDNYALWELNYRLSIDKTDILPNQQQTRPKTIKK